MVRKHPFASVMLAGLIPNLFAALFNIVYNQAEILEHWSEAKKVFGTIVPPINAVFFSIGILIMVVSILQRWFADLWISAQSTNQ